MAADSMDTKQRSNEAADPVEAVRSYLDELPPKDGLASAVEEGRRIADIVAPLGLPETLHAAVLVYPLYRDGILSNKALQNNAL